MKTRLRNSFAIIISVCIITAAFLPAFADDAEESAAPDMRKTRVSLGVSLDYLWWDPVWRRISQAGDMFFYYLLNRSVPFLKIEKRSRLYDVDPALLAGVDLDVRFPKGWGLSASARAGAYRDSSVMVASVTTNLFSPSEYIRYRIDTVNFGGSLLAAYRFAEWGGVSLGPVYRGCVLRDRTSSYLSSQSRKETIHEVGLRAGASFDVRLVDNLFIRPSASFLYLYGTVTGQSNVSARDHSHAVGGDAEASLAYFVEKIRITFSLGFRCRVLHYLEVTNPDYLNRWDSSYGLTESITYTF
ncbi:MAG: hypothetical protein JW807_04085 [Spirochaetes bacterium]|nr:hypothetical protein [Spirochaetota bacterium]